MEGLVSQRLKNDDSAEKRDVESHESTPTETPVLLNKVNKMNKFKKLRKGKKAPKAASKPEEEDEAPSTSLFPRHSSNRLFMLDTTVTICRMHGALSAYQARGQG